MTMFILENVTMTERNQVARLTVISVQCTPNKPTYKNSDVHQTYTVKFPSRTVKCDYSILGKPQDAYYVPPSIYEGGMSHLVVFKHFMGRTSLVNMLERGFVAPGARSSTSKNQPEELESEQEV